MTRGDWAKQPYLDALRPESGWQTDVALLASYSVDLVALVAGLLALAGLDDDRGSGSKVDLATALDTLRGRVRMVAQAGRVTSPARTTKILAILDQFVREVKSDEATGSWHPKIALVRLKADGGEQTRWRLWIGSRNLTRDTSWDVGLVIEGHEGGGGRPVPGLAELGRELASRAQLPAASPARISAELARVRWNMPKGCEMEELRLLVEPERSLPEPPPGLRKLTVVSPFLDGTTIGTLGRWGDDQTHRLLVSTQTELAKLAAQAGKPLAGFRDLLYLDAPSAEPDEQPESADETVPSSEDLESEQAGLHAKLICAEHAGGRSLWLGSANATQRGWVGPNIESIARMTISAEIAAGLQAFVEQASYATLDALPAHEEDEVEERLEAARRQIAARWDVIDRVNDGQPTLEAGASPHPDDPEIRLSVGLLGQPLVEWSRGESRIVLPHVSPGELTELVSCEIRLGLERRCWVQRTPLEPPLGKERDERALARFLDPRTFLLWIRSQLTNDPLSEGGGDWDAPRESARVSPNHAGPMWWAPTLEEVLRAWTRNPATLTDIDRKIRRYLHSLDQQAAETGEDGPTPDERAVVTEFRHTWDVLRRELVAGAA